MQKKQPNTADAKVALNSVAPSEHPHQANNLEPSLISRRSANYVMHLIYFQINQHLIEECVVGHFVHIEGEMICLGDEIIDRTDALIKAESLFLNSMKEEFTKETALFISELNGIQLRIEN